MISCDSSMLRSLNDSTWRMFQVRVEKVFTNFEFGLDTRGHNLADMHFALSEIASIKMKFWHYMAGSMKGALNPSITS